MASKSVKEVFNMSKKVRYRYIQNLVSGGSWDLEWQKNVKRTSKKCFKITNKSRKMSKYVQKSPSNRKNCLKTILEISNVKNVFKKPKCQNSKYVKLSKKTRQNIWRKQKMCQMLSRNVEEVSNKCQRKLDIHMTKTT